MAGILEIHFFLWQDRVPIVIGLTTAVLKYDENVII